MKQCYMCTQEAVSDEHVPPKCIFPEAKDLPSGINYRKNLITVPSCLHHNLSKSGDDEYLLFVLVTNWAINNAGLNHWKTKILRSINTRPSKIGIYKNPRPLVVDGISTGAFEIDFERIEAEIIKISRALFYFHTQKQWLFPIDIVMPSAIAIDNTDNRNSNIHNSVMRTTTSIIMEFLSSEIVNGENPDIFYYQYKIDEGNEKFALRMVFYGGIEISAFSQIDETA